MNYCRCNRKIPRNATYCKYCIRPSLEWDKRERGLYGEKGSLMAIARLKQLLMECSQ